MVEIKMLTSKADLRQFIELPYQLYEKEPNWVPPLRLSQRSLYQLEDHPFWKKNPFRFYLAFKGGECVGRIAAFTCAEHQSQVRSTDGFFGFLEAKNDKAIFTALLKAAEEFLTSVGCATIIGPYPSIHHELGILVHGFETPPYFMLLHHFPYYGPLILASGYVKAHDFYSYMLSTNEVRINERWNQAATYLCKRYPLSLRNPKMMHFEEELEIFWRIYNDAFAAHWSFSAISWEEFKHLAKDMKKLIDPRIIFIAELNGEPIGFLLALPNLNEVLINIHSGRLWPTGFLRLIWGMRRIKSLRVITLAVMQKYQHLGIGSLFYTEFKERAAKLGYVKGELSWVSEDNINMNKVACHLNATPTKHIEFIKSH